MNSVARRIFGSELMIWLVLCGIGLYILYPLRQSLRFGIDLVGGTYLTLEVQADKAIEAALISKMQSIESQLKRNRTIRIISKKIDNNVLTFIFDDSNQAQEAMRLIKSDEKDLSIDVDKQMISIQFTSNAGQRLKDDAVIRNIEVLRTRLDKFSVAEIAITKQGDRHIVVELPDVANPQEAKEMIGRAANLEFKIVEKVGPNEQELLFEYDGDLPDDLEILPGERRDSYTSFYVVQKFATVTGRMLSDARPAMGGQTGVDPVVEFTFNDEGAEKFYALTSKNHGKSLAIVLDGEVISAPVIQAAIRSRGSITGNFTSAEVKKLAYLLKSGSFVAPVTFEEERQIGPSLGEDSIKSGLHSCLAGLGILLIFSLYYYKGVGILALLALVYNLILILLGMAWLKATLTLPGIAGMVLTIGMAIDASILIFERIKEELHAGSALKKAIDTGFSGAMSVILDANITSFIVGLVLYNFGTGPIQGFAVTLMLGILATLVATLFFMRSIFKFILANFTIQKLSI